VVGIVGGVAQHAARLGEPEQLSVILLIGNDKKARIEICRIEGSFVPHQPPFGRQPRNGFDRSRVHVFHFRSTGGKDGDLCRQFRPFTHNQAAFPLNVKEDGIPKVQVWAHPSDCRAGG
jgi:hypothetical protein